jgi:hypothetical protein
MPCAPFPVPLECARDLTMSFSASFAVLAPTEARASSAFRRKRAVPALKTPAFGKAKAKVVVRRSVVPRNTSSKHDRTEITPMMLTTSALGAFGSACLVVLLASTVEATSVVAARTAAETEESLAHTTEYMSRKVPVQEKNRVTTTRPATAPAVTVEAEHRKTGQELFECDIQGFRCVT